ncbi:hypothetical protein DN069_10015 [Streptacidiphilus pinicola]|uniref:Uncharacterized protein n=1 Tax=Streptacidiphilus pinicola TaxID=2219663 RepID=A0A2X0KG51_9ACTN|nr:hypothetical protein DN069_10015 [Streptacidiphilus pinicola]
MTRTLLVVPRSKRGLKWVVTVGVAVVFTVVLWLVGIPAPWAEAPIGLLIGRVTFEWINVGRGQR